MLLKPRAKLCYITRSTELLFNVSATARTCGPNCTIQRRSNDHRLPRPLHFRAPCLSRISQAANRRVQEFICRPALPQISDDQIREKLEPAQLKFQRERGTDLTIFSPRASGMGHHVGDAKLSASWTRICNDMIHRIVNLYPKNFIGVCQLPQSHRRAARELHSRNWSAA